jgi:hypothetical protein
VTAPERAELPDAVRLSGAPTDRIRIAETALRAALGVPGVLEGNGGGRRRLVTGAPGGALPGVVAAAERGGRYGVDLYLTAALVPLRPLADRVRRAVAVRVEEIGLGPVLGPVNVTFLDVERGADR